jgi:hypothetical protein
MSHTCPICGSACYCNGDIDDIVLPDFKAECACTCCIEEDIEEQSPVWGKKKG